VGGEKSNQLGSQHLSKVIFIQADVNQYIKDFSPNNGMIFHCPWGRISYTNSSSLSPHPPPPKKKKKPVNNLGVRNYKRNKYPILGYSKTD